MKIIDEGFANNDANHAKTQAMLNELLKLSSQKTTEQKTAEKEQLIYERELLYNGIMNSFEFLVNRFCLLSHTSKVIEFAYLPSLIEIFKDTISEHKDKMTESFQDILFKLLSRMTIEDDEHLNGLDEKSLGLKQINFKVAYNAFKQTYEVFMACKYNDDFDFWYFMNWQNEHNRYDRNAMLVKGLEEISDLSKDEILNPMTGTILNEECLNICLIGHQIETGDIDKNELLSLFPDDMFNDYDKSERINPEAYEELKKIMLKNINGELT